MCYLNFLWKLGAVSRSNLRASIKILSKSEPPYCYLIDQYFHRSQLKVCKIQFIYFNPILRLSTWIFKNPDYISFFYKIIVGVSFWYEHWGPAITRGAASWQIGPRFKFTENILCSHRKLYPHCSPITTRRLSGPLLRRELVLRSGQRPATYFITAEGRRLAELLASRDGTERLGGPGIIFLPHPFGRKKHN